MTRWKQGETPDPENEAKEEEAIGDWLHGFNPHLSDKPPLEVLRSGRLSDVIRAIEAEKSGAFA